MKPKFTTRQDTKRVLYITYDGVLEPLGQSQVLAYLEHLARDYTVHLVSFEKPEDWKLIEERNGITRRMLRAGIHWHPRRYHKRPSALATAWDIGVGIVSSVWLVLRYRLRIVHARSYVPSVMALAIKRMTGTKYLFDMRGFWADERVDGGLWPRGGRLYRIAKWFERRFLLNADHVVSLTHAAVREMQKFPYLQYRMPPMTVIPTCADLERFRPTDQPKPGLVVGYVGSAGTWYLFDATVACFATLLRLRPDARILIVNRNEHAYIRERLAAGGISESAVELRSAKPDEIPGLMARMHCTVFFIKPVFSKQASAPTKLAEFLACGIPCLVNAGIGDMAEIVSAEQVGVAVDRFDEESLKDGLRRLVSLLDDSSVGVRCANAAARHFSLDEGARRYRRIWMQLAGVQE